MEHRRRLWRFLSRIARLIGACGFAFRAEPFHSEGPCLIVCNHVTNWDPILLCGVFPDTPVRFVASEHIFRHGLVSRLIERLVAPIPRRKASSGVDTVKSCLRALKAGDTVGLFAEGDACWDGRSHAVFPATGKLARASGATLITCRLEGGYLTQPRWALRRRRGRMRCTVVGVYPPEKLKSMQGEAITALINRDIFEDAWERVRQEPTAFRGRGLAEGFERGFFLCPACRGFGTLRGRGDAVRCACGFHTALTAQGTFEPPEPFETLADWDAWQTKTLREMQLPADKALFSDEGLSLKRVGSGHAELTLGRGTLTQYRDALRFGERSFPLDEIGSMAMVKANLLLLSCGDEYYELRAGRRCCLRKYLAVWQSRTERARQGE